MEFSRHFSSDQNIVIRILEPSALRVNERLGSRVFTQFFLALFVSCGARVLISDWLT